VGLRNLRRGGHRFTSHTHHSKKGSLPRPPYSRLNPLSPEYDLLLQGISDTPTWVVSKANQYAKDHGKTPFCVYQGNWSILERSFERDIIPMARSEGLALAPWGVLGSGKIRTNAEEARRRESGEKGRTILNPNWERTPAQKKMCDALEEIAREVGTESITARMSMIFARWSFRRYPKFDEHL
jgi:aryl-alcohol dehydrogenase-like predicted oxidoreductase